MSEWIRSSRCDSASCVLVARDVDRVRVRDGKQADGPTLTFNRAAWRDFLHALAGDEFAAAIEERKAA